LTHPDFAALVTPLYVVERGKGERRKEKGERGKGKYCSSPLCAAEEG